MEKSRKKHVSIRGRKHRDFLFQREFSNANAQVSRIVISFNESYLICCARQE